MNFTLQHMDVSCEAYNHFSHCMSQLQGLVDGRCSFRVEQLPSNFTQFLVYERIEQLVRETLTHIIISYWKQYLLLNFKQTLTLRPNLYSI